METAVIAAMPTGVIRTAIEYGAMADMVDTIVHPAATAVLITENAKYGIHY